MKNFDVEEIVGRGTYGIVYKARWKKSQDLVAVKEINLESLRDEGIPSTALREISLLQAMQENEGQHENVVKLFEVSYCAVDPHLILVFEFVDRDLRKYMNDELKTSNDVRNRADAKTGQFASLPISKVKHFAEQLLMGIKHCHHSGVIHRDLKPQNVLITNTDVIKIADFGLARALNVPLRTYTREVVTLWYRCPELLLGVKQYAFAVDMWSLGCIIGELLNSKPLFTGDSEIGQIFTIFKKLGTPRTSLTELPDFNPEFPKWEEPHNKISKLCPRLENEALAVPLFEGLLRYDPVERLRTEEALALEFFSSDLKENAKKKIICMENQPISS